MSCFRNALMSAIYISFFCVHIQHYCLLYEMLALFVFLVLVDLFKDVAGRTHLEPRDLFSQRPVALPQNSTKK